jgi:hypothetical protein
MLAMVGSCSHACNGGWWFACLQATCTAQLCTMQQTGEYAWHKGTHGSKNTTRQNSMHARTTMSSECVTRTTTTGDPPPPPPSAHDAPWRPCLTVLESGRRGGTQPAPQQSRTRGPLQRPRQRHGMPLSTRLSPFSHQRQLTRQMSGMVRCSAFEGMSARASEQFILPSTHEVHRRANGP